MVVNGFVVVLSPKKKPFYELTHSNCLKNEPIVSGTLLCLNLILNRKMRVVFLFLCVRIFVVAVVAQTIRFVLSLSCFFISCTFRRCCFFHCFLFVFYSASSITSFEMRVCIYDRPLQ